MTASLIDAAVIQNDTGGFFSSITLPFAKAVAAGKTLVLLVGNRWGDPWPPTLTDSQGNTYTEDVSRSGGGIQIAVFHSVLDHSLSTSDTLTFTSPGGRVYGSYVVFAASFGGVTGLDVAGSVAVLGSGALDATVTPSDGDLLFGGHCSVSDSTDDTSAPWTELLNWNRSAMGQSAVYAVAGSGSTVHYRPSATGDEVAVVIAFTAAVVPTIEPTGIASDEGFGEPTLIPILGIHPTGIPSDEAVGVPRITDNTIRPLGIESGEEFGGVWFLDWKAQVIRPEPWDDDEAVGEPALADIGTTTIYPVGIA